MSAEFVVFVIFAIASLAGAITLVAARNPVYSAMGLLLTMFSMAVFYVLNDAHFIAAVQVIIYAGAVMTLFLFVIMLIGVDKQEDREEQIPFHRQLVAFLGAALLVLLFLAGQGAWVVFDGGTAPVGTIEAISDALFGTWMLPFQATILLLTIAAVGSVALARYEGPAASPKAVPDVADDESDESVSPPSGGKVGTEEVPGPANGSSESVSPPSGGKVGTAEVPGPAKPGVGGST